MQAFFTSPSRRALGAAVAVVAAVAVPLALIAESDPDRTGGGRARAAAPPPTTASGSAPARAAVARPDRLPPLLYAGNRGGGYRLYAARPDGSGERRVADVPAMFPAWSPDGRRIAFVGEAAGFTARRIGLTVIDDDGALRDVLAGPQVPAHPAFRPGGEQLWYQSALQESNGAAGVSEASTIDRVGLDGASQRTIVDRGGAVYQPAWSPDGRRLALVAGEPGCHATAARRCRQRLVLADERGAHLRTLVGDGAAGAPAWSPDGSRIAFTWDRGAGPQLWTVAVADGQARQLTDRGGAVSEPAWSPDGRAIAFARDCDVHVLLLDGGGAARNVTRSRPCEISPAWRPKATP